jgi:putative oxidoreductase
VPSLRSVPTPASSPTGDGCTDKDPSEVDATVSRWAGIPTPLHRARALDRLIADTLRPLALPSLRVLLGLLFIWFGGLKVAGVSPVKAMVASTLPWADPDVIVPLLGGAEVLLGLGLVTGVALRLVLPALAAHLAGTFVTFVMLPGQMFHHSKPLLLTENGEFVTKNLVLLSATLVLISYTYRPVAPVPIPGPRRP